MCQSTECISELLRKALLPVENKPPPPQITEQLLFDIDGQFCSKTKSDKITFLKYENSPLKRRQDALFSKNHGVSVKKA